MDVKPKNWVISKKTDAAGRVKVEVLLTDIGDALDVGSPIDIRTQITATWEYTPPSIMVAIAVGRILAMRQDKQCNTASWSQVDVAHLDGQLKGLMPPCAHSQIDEHAVGMMILNEMGYSWVLEHFDAGGRSRELEQLYADGDPAYLGEWQTFFDWLVEPYHKILKREAFIPHLQPEGWGGRYEELIRWCFGPQAYTGLASVPVNNDQQSIDNVISDLKNRGLAALNTIVSDEVPAEDAKEAGSSDQSDSPDDLIDHEDDDHTLLGSITHHPKHMSCIENTSARLSFRSKLQKYRLTIFGEVNEDENHGLLTFHRPDLFGVGDRFPLYPDTDYVCNNIHFGGSVCEFAANRIDRIIEHMLNGQCQPSRRVIDPVSLDKIRKSKLGER